MLAGFLDAIGLVAGDGVQVGRLAVALSVHRPVKRIGAAKDAGHRVVVPGRDRVKLVVVAAGARDGQAEERPGRHVDLLIDDVELEEHLVALVQRLGAKREETGGDQFLVGRFAFVAAKQVAGNLFPHEPAKRLVVVKRVDHVVAVAPRVRVGEVALHAVGLAVAGDVEPVPAPVLAEMRRAQQLVDDFLEGVHRRVAQKRGNLSRRGRETDQVKVSPADEFVASGIAHWR